MKKIITTVLCATIAVCNTLNAQENMEMKEKTPFAYVDAKTTKVTMTIRSDWYMLTLSRKTKREE